MNNRFQFVVGRFTDHLFLYHIRYLIGTWVLRGGETQYNNSGKTTWLWRDPTINKLNLDGVAFGIRTLNNAVPSLPSLLRNKNIK